MTSKQRQRYTPKGYIYMFLPIRVSEKVYTVPNLQWTKICWWFGTSQYFSVLYIKLVHKWIFNLKNDARNSLMHNHEVMHASRKFSILLSLHVYMYVKYLHLPNLAFCCQYSLIFPLSLSLSLSLPLSHSSARLVTSCVVCSSRTVMARAPRL